MTTVAIHQPNYLPYLGFFDKIKHCDIFVILDDADFTKGEFFQRNKIRTSLNTPKSVGWIWLTVPVEEKHVPCNQILIKDLPWAMHHWTQIYTSYRKSPHWSEFSEGLEEIYTEAIFKKVYKRQIDLNVDLINLLIKYFGLTAKVVFASTLGITTTGTQRLVDIVKALGGDTYLSGVGGRDYLDVSLFEKSGIKIIFQDFNHPVYKQRYSGFVPNMCALDYLFNVGGKLP